MVVIDRSRPCDYPSFAVLKEVGAGLEKIWGNARQKPQVLAMLP